MTDIFHYLLMFTLSVLFSTLLMKLFSNRAFVELEDNIRNKLNSTQRLLYPKLMTSSDKFYSLGGCCLNVSTTQISKWLASSQFSFSFVFRFQLRWKIISASMENNIVTLLHIFLRFLYLTLTTPRSGMKGSFY